MSILREDGGEDVAQYGNASARACAEKRCYFVTWILFILQDMMEKMLISYQFYFNTLYFQFCMSCKYYDLLDLLYHLKIVSDFNVLQEDFFLL